MSAERLTREELRLDESELYREEIFTDLKVGSIRRLSPVTKDGRPDTSRPILYVGQTQILTQVGPLPVQARIEARSLDDAIAKFPAAIEEAVAGMMDELRDLQRREMSRIVVPGADTASKILGGPQRPPQK